MKHMSILMTLLLILLSCSTEENQIDITGNWYNYKNTTPTEYIAYVESYITDDKIYLYEEGFGFTNYEGESYSIENDVLCFTNAEKGKDQVTPSEIEVIDENSFMIKTKRGNITLKRIKKDSGLLLENVYIEKVHEDDYKKFFSARKIEWYKTDKRN